MKKKSFYLCAMMAVALCAGFTSCGDDDDDNNGGGGGGSASGTPSPTLTDKDGNTLRVLAVGPVRFNYDENGRLSAFGDSDYWYEIEGNSFTVTDEDGYMAKFALNGNGLISKINMSYNERYGNNYGKENVTISYKYNSNRQLTGADFSGSGEWKYEEDNVAESYKGTGTMTTTWKNGNLVKAVSNSRSDWKENGHSYKTHEIGTFTYTYGDVVNPLKQFPYFMSDGTTGMEEFGLFCVVGLYGVGPVNLPNGYTEQWEDEEDSYEPESNSYTLSYTLNENGTINTESKGSYYKVTYQYGFVNRSVVDQAESLMPALKVRMSSLFKHKRHQ